VFTVFAAGAADRVFLSVGIPYNTQVWLFRAAFFLVPPAVYLAVRRITAEAGS
jgi:hypothetical protein